MSPTRLQIPKKVTGSYPFHPPNLRSPFPPGTIGIPDRPSQVGLGPKPAPPSLAGEAQAEIDPILKRISDAITLRAQNAGKAISGYTGALANAVAGVDYAAPYAQPIQQQASVDAALHQALSGGGAALASDLSSRLAQIGEPGVIDPVAAGLAARGTAAGNTELARGSSSLGALIANEGAAKSYGAKMPGIARLAGLQDLAGANQKAQTDIRDQTAQVETQLPSIVNALRSAHATQQSLTERKREFGISSGQSDKKTKAALILANGIDPATGTLTPAASAALSKLLGIGGLTGVSASAAEKRAHDQATEQQGQARIDATATNRTRTQGNSDRQYRLSWAKTYHYDPTTLQPTPGWHFDKRGSLVKDAKAGGNKVDKNHGLTANEAAGFRGTALTLADTAFNGGTDSKGNPLPKLDYNAAVLEAEKEGIPEWIYRPALESFYKAGGSRSPIAGPPAPKGR